MDTEVDESGSFRKEYDGGDDSLNETGGTASEKLENIRKWVHTQALNVTTSKVRHLSILASSVPGTALQSTTLWNGVQVVSDSSSTFSKPVNGDADDDSSEKQDSVVPLLRLEPVHSKLHYGEPDRKECSSSSLSLPKDEFDSKKSSEDGTGSFDFEQFSESSPQSHEYGSKNEPLSTTSFASAFGQERKQLGTDSPLNLTSFVNDLNKRLLSLGYSPVDCKKSKDALCLLSKKLLLILGDVEQGRNTVKRLTKDVDGWKPKEQLLTSRISSLERQLSECQKSKERVSSSNFSANEEKDKKIRKLQEIQRELDTENRRLKNNENMLQHKLKETESRFSVIQTKLQGVEKEKGKLKEQVECLNGNVKSLEKKHEDFQKQQKPLENANRLKDTELSQLRIAYESLLDEQERLGAKSERFETAFKDQERETLRLKQILQNGDKVQEVKQALKTAQDETKALKEDLSMERSKRNSVEQKNERLISELKRSQQSSVDLEKQLKAKEDEMFNLNIEHKRLKADLSILVMQRDAEQSSTSSSRKSSLRERLEKMEKEKKAALQKEEELRQMHKFLQKENLELKEEQLEFEKAIQRLKSETTRATDDLLEKTYDLKETKEKLREVERALKSAECQTVDGSCSLKGHEIDNKLIQKTNTELISVKHALEHKVHSLENACKKLKDALRGRIEKEERRERREKEAFQKLQERAASLSASDLRRVLSRGDIFYHAERKIEELEEEVELLRGEKRKLLSEVRSHENQSVEAKNTKKIEKMTADQTKNRLRLAERSITDLSAKLNSSREMNAKEQKCFVAEKRNLEAQISEQKVMIHTMQQQINISSNNNSSQQVQVVSAETHPSSTSSRVVKKDRAGRIPRPHLEKTIKTLCLMLQIKDPLLLVEQVSKLIRVVSCLPKVERFISSVCDIVLCKGSHFIPHYLQSTTERDVSILVPSILNYWLEENLMRR